MPSKRSVPATASIPVPLSRRLNILAKHHDISRAALIRAAIKREVDEGFEALKGNTR